MKKLISLVLALAMVLLCVGAAMAAVETGDSSITITRDPSYTGGDGTTDQSGNETYTYYRILFATYATSDLAAVNANTGELSSTTGKAAYYVTNQTEANALSGLKVKNSSNQDVALFTVTQSTDGTRYNVQLAYADATAVQIADALYTIKDSFPSATVTRNNAADVTIQNVAKGYYLIESSLGSKLAVQTLGQVTIKEKNTYPGVDKKQDDNASPTYADDDVNVKVGDIIYYSVEVTVPQTANGDITLTDTMSTGLTYNTTPGLTWAISNNSKTITADTDATANDHDYKVVTAGTGETWKAIIHANDNTRGETITVTYQATVNEDALTETTKRNEIKLQYSNYTKKDWVYFHTYTSGMIKFDGDIAEVKNDDTVGLKEGKDGTYLLQNAEFELQVSDNGSSGWTKLDVIKDGTYYRPLDPTKTTPEVAETAIKSDGNGEIIIRGLDNEKYYRLVETKVPQDGYNLATTPVSLTLTVDAKAGVTISGQGSDTVTKIAPANVGKLANNKGTQLPSTGGIGTTIFYILGGLLVVGAAVILVARRKASN